MKKFSDAPRSDRRERDWPRINRELKRRGDLTVWIDTEATTSWEKPPTTGKPGRPARYHDNAIITMLTIGAIYGMKLRQSEGFMCSLFRLMGLLLSVPDYTTLSRRMEKLNITLPRRARPGEAIHVVIDSTGLKVYGAGEWHMHKHGLRKRRTFRKLHLFLDADTCEIIDAELTPSTVHDGTLLPTFLANSDEDIHTLSADGAYDQEACYAALARRDIRAVIPPRKDAVLYEGDDPSGAWALRNENITQINDIGLEAWKHKNGYYKQSKAENGMYRYKAIFGGRLSSRIFASQKNEAKIRCMALNKMLNVTRQT